MLIKNSRGKSRREEAENLTQTELLNDATMTPQLSVAYHYKQNLEDDFFLNDRKVTKNTETLGRPGGSVG